MKFKKPTKFECFQDQIFFLFLISNKFHKFSHQFLKCLTWQAADFTGLRITAVNVRAVVTCPIISAASCRRKIFDASATMKRKDCKNYLKFPVQLLTHFHYERRWGAPMCSKYRPSWTAQPSSCLAYGQLPTATTFASSISFRNSPGRKDRRANGSRTLPMGGNLMKKLETSAVERE